MKWALPFSLSFVLGLVFAGCGGSSPPASSATSSAHEADSSDSSHDEPTADDAPADEEAPKAGACDDGTCSSCGSGICPAGWYCDESAAGGPACGWLPACAAGKATSCGCLTAKLGSSCKCSEQSGGLHVTCK